MDPSDATPKEHAARDWDKFSNPKVLQQNLVLAGLYLVAYELLRGSVLDRLRHFFSSRTVITPEGKLEGTPEPKYASEVLALYPKDAFQASCLWLLKMRALAPEDLTEIKSIVDHRNELAHELPSFIAEANRELDLRLLERIHFLVAKIERWWIREIDIPSNPQYDGREIADEDIKPGIVMFLEMVLATALHGGETVAH